MFIVFLLIWAPASAGEITGSVSLKTADVPERAKNTNPNRKRNIKKYGMKTLRQAQAGGKGGLPRNETVDERDYVVVYLSRAKDGAKLKATPKNVPVEQRERRFFDHVTPVVLGSKVVFVNEDKFFHHIYCPDASNMNVPEHRGEVSRKPTKLGKLELFCDIHPLMNAYVYVVPNDSFAMAKSGKFAIKNVPAGDYVLKTWHPRLPGGSYPVTVPASGQAKVDVTL